MVLLSIIIAAILFVITTVIHAGGMTLAVRTVRKEEEHWGLERGRTHVFIVCEAVLMMFLISLLEVLAYTVTYLVLNALPDFEEAFYFSMVTLPRSATEMFFSTKTGGCLPHSRQRMELSCLVGRQLLSYM